MKLSKTWRWIIGAALVILILTFVGKSAGWVGGPARVAVDTARVERLTLSERISASGGVYPAEEVKVSADVSGEIVDVFVQEGEAVQAGDLLVHIRSDNFETALQRQEATLAQASTQLRRMRGRLVSEEAELVQIQKDYERQRQLLGQQVVSRARYEQAEARYLAKQQSVEAARLQIQEQEYAITRQRASVSEARENLRLTRIYAPMTGYVTRLFSKKGERVVGTQQMSGTDIMHVADLGKMEVRVYVIENDIIRLSVGDSAQIDFESFEYLDYRPRGIVTAIATSAKQKNTEEDVTEYEVKIHITPSTMDSLRLLTRQDSPIRPGMTASVEIITETKTNVVAAPLASVTLRAPDGETREGGRSRRERKDDAPVRANNPNGNTRDTRQEVLFVYDPEAKTVRMQKVKTGINDLDHIEIIEGVSERTLVVSGPFLAISRRLKEGTHVEIRKPGNAQRGRQGR